MGDKLLAEIEYSFCVTRNEIIIDYFHLDHLHGCLPIKHMQ